MTLPLAPERLAPDAPVSLVSPPRVAYARSALAVLWAVGLVVAVGNDVPRTDSTVPLAAAVLLTTYPLIDLIATVVLAGGRVPSARPVRIAAAVDVVAVIGVGVASFAFDAGAALAAFGIWAAVSGALQLGVAVRARREGRQVSMIVSGGLSVAAGLSFVAAAGRPDADLSALGGYMVFGGVLYVVWALRGGATPGRTAAVRP